MLLPFALGLVIGAVATFVVGTAIVIHGISTPDQ